MLDLSPLTACLQKELIGSYFADSGPFAREHYPKHIEAMAATAKYKRCTIFGANRVGKTLGWANAGARFATGRYPAGGRAGRSTSRSSSGRAASRAHWSATRCSGT